MGQRPAAERPRFAPPCAPLQRACGNCAATRPLGATARKKGTSGHPNAPAGAALGVIRCARAVTARAAVCMRPGAVSGPVPRHGAALHRPGPRGQSTGPLAGLTGRTAAFI